MLTPVPPNQAIPEDSYSVLRSNYLTWLNSGVLRSSQTKEPHVQIKTRVAGVLAATAAAVINDSGNTANGDFDSGGF